MAKPNLYIQEIFDKNTTNPSSLKLLIPTISSSGGEGSQLLCGLLASEPTIVTGNKWGPILNDISLLSFFASLAQMSSIPSWIGASVQCWKGTDPLRINLDFYLVNYSRGLKLEQGLKALTKLTSLTGAQGTFTSVYVHGGYMAKPLATNAARFNNSIADKVNNGQMFSDIANPEEGKNWIDKFNDWSATWSTDVNNNKGCVSIVIGNKVKIGGLLVASVNVTPSIVEVCSSEDVNDDPLPLYYHVTLSLIGNRPLISDDVDKMYSRG